MSDKEPKPETTSKAAEKPQLSNLEYKIRRYEAKMSFWKIAVGTTLVGLASILVPGAIQFWDLQFKSARQAVELDISQAQARRDEITTFIEYALNEDIELRLRMAEYFSVVTEGNPNDASSDRARWTEYHANLSSLRDITKEKILDREKKRAKLERTPANKLNDDEAVQLVVLDLELKWLYGELGRAARGKSVIATANETNTSTTEANCPVEEKYKFRDNSMHHLHPAVREKVTLLISRLNSEGIPFQLFEGFRSPFRQDQLFAAGRTRPGNKVTWVGPWSSVHQYGLAVDLVLRIDNKWSWDSSGDKKLWWDRMHELAKELGLTTVQNAHGQIFEIPHVQLPNIKPRDLLDGKFPEGGDTVWAENILQNAAAWQECENNTGLTEESIAKLAQVSRVANN